MKNTETFKIIDIDTAITMMEEINTNILPKNSSFDEKEARKHNSRMTRLNIQAYAVREREIRNEIEAGLNDESWVGSEEHKGLSELYSNLTDLMFA